MSVRRLALQYFISRIRIVILTSSLISIRFQPKLFDFRFGKWCVDVCKEETKTNLVGQVSVSAASIGPDLI